MPVLQFLALWHSVFQGGHFSTCLQKQRHHQPREQRPGRYQEVTEKSVSITLYHPMHHKWLACQPALTTKTPIKFKKGKKSS
jgi:hypothetical protein